MDPNPGAEGWFLVLTTSLPRPAGGLNSNLNLILELVSAFLMEESWSVLPWRWSPAPSVAFPEGFGQKVSTQLFNRAIPDGCVERLPGGARGVCTEIVAHPTESLMPVARGD